VLVHASPSCRILEMLSRYHYPVVASKSPRDLGMPNLTFNWGNLWETFQVASTIRLESRRFTCSQCSVVVALANLCSSENSECVYVQLYSQTRSELPALLPASRPTAVPILWFKPFTRPVCRNDVDQIRSRVLFSAYALVCRSHSNNMSVTVQQGNMRRASISESSILFISACARVDVSRLPYFGSTMTVMWAYIPPHSPLPRATEQS
jgi:hypothetical protein